MKNQISSGHPEGFDLFSLVWVSSCDAQESSDDRLGFRPYSEILLSSKMTIAFCNPVLASVVRLMTTYCQHLQRRRQKTTANHGQRQTAGENKGRVKYGKCSNEKKEEILYQFEKLPYSSTNKFFLRKSHKRKRSLVRSQDVRAVDESSTEITITSHDIYTFELTSIYVYF